LTYRFDNIEGSANKQRLTQNISGSFSGNNPQDIEIRRKIASLLKFVNDLMQKGIIAVFSIYRSSLEQVFMKIIKSQQNDEKVMTIQGEEELDTNNLGEKASI